MKKIMAILLFMVFGGLSCSDKDNAKTGQVVPEEHPQAMDAGITSKFEIEVYLDTVSGEAEQIAGRFLKASLLTGDYRSAIEYLCVANHEIIAADSLMNYVIYGKNNPDWDSLTAFKFDLTRRFIPVLAAMNELQDLRRLSCHDSCSFEYKVAGPLSLKKIYETALGPDGKRQFDRLLDSNLSLQAKTEYYNWAFQRIAFVADSMTIIRRAVTDTLILIKEGPTWKICKTAQTGFEIFRQN